MQTYTIDASKTTLNLVRLFFETSKWIMERFSREIIEKTKFPRRIDWQRGYCPSHQVRSVTNMLVGDLEYYQYEWWIDDAHCMLILPLPLLLRLVCSLGRSQVYFEQKVYHVTQPDPSIVVWQDVMLAIYARGPKFDNWCGYTICTYLLLYQNCKYWWAQRLRYLRLCLDCSRRKNGHRISNKNGTDMYTSDSLVSVGR